MPRSDREQRKLLRRTSQSLGIIFTVSSAACLIVPNIPTPEAVALGILLFAVTGLAFYFVGESRSWLWPLTAYLSGLASLAVFLLPGSVITSPATGNGVVLFAATAIPSLLIAIVSSMRSVWLAIAGFLPVVALTVIVCWNLGAPLLALASVLVGWIALYVVAAWLNASVLRAFGGIERLARAHSVERQASETEAQRRQSARLLHDTVLATLTLLAHSGIGVNPDALRNQAAEDARLLRQLRLGGTPMPRASGGYTLEPVETSDLGHTLESVKQRFGRMGLRVAWHGSGQILLPSHVLDAFLLSLSECLENVRRHAGVGSADVTITEDDTTVRAMVTDAGVGFDLEAIDVGRLGLAESVIARVKDVGGKVRLFSAPGSGTTVVLEVPK
jgi:signal transduction histidine kinase